MSLHTEQHLCGHTTEFLLDFPIFYLTPLAVRAGRVSPFIHFLPRVARFGSEAQESMGKLMGEEYSEV